MWTLGPYSSGVLCCCLNSGLTSKTRGLCLMCLWRCLNVQTTSCSFSKQAPHGTKTSPIPVKTRLTCIKRRRSQAKELCARASQSVLGWNTTAHHKNSRKKKNPRYLVKNTSLVAAVSRKRPHVQLKIPGSGVPARFCRLKHTIRRNGSGSDTRSTGILLFWPDTVRCRWARDGQNLWNETGNVS